MIDLIIPVYNNYQGLLQTLATINLDIFKVTVVDDCSDQPIETSFPINYIRLEENSGPGWARQVGINNTKNTYISFIDAGDVFLSKEIQQEMYDNTMAHPEINFFIWSYYLEEKMINEYDNRMHGKIYKRSFLNKYNISFCKEGSYVNEDIGFNRACRLCTYSENSMYQFIEKPVIQWVANENSITKKNNNEFIYRQQNKGLALNSINTINICKANGIKTKEEIHIIAASLYYYFILTAADRPEFLQEAWSGAKIFYDYFKKEIKPNQLIGGNGYIRKCLDLRKKIHFPINILRFVEEIEKYEIIPDKYLT